MESDELDVVDAFANVEQGLNGENRTQMLEYWQHVIDDIERIPDDGSGPDVFKSSDLPLARIKKVMKTDSDVKMIAAEAPVLFAKACDVFISELAMRAWIHAKENKRRTLQRSDIATAIQRSDVFDFLIDIVPREEAQTRKSRPGSMMDDQQPHTPVQNTEQSLQSQIHQPGMPTNRQPQPQTQLPLQAPLQTPLQASLQVPLQAPLQGGLQGSLQTPQLQTPLQAPLSQHLSQTPLSQQVGQLHDVHLMDDVHIPSPRNTLEQYDMNVVENSQQQVHSNEIQGDMQQSSMDVALPENDQPGYSNYNLEDGRKDISEFAYQLNDQFQVFRNM